MAIEIIPNSSGLGTEIRNLKLTEALSADDRAALQATWRESPVVLIRGERISNEQLIAFTRNLGEPQGAPRSEVEFKDVPPEIAIISNVMVGGRPVGSLGSGEAEWHTDSSCDERPPSASLLHAMEIPPVGGDTQFCNMYLAYEALPDELKAKIAGRRAIHDATYTSSGGLRQGRQHLTDVRQAPGAHHPLVITHPDSGRKALFLGRRRNAYIVDMPLEESEELLDTLWAHAIQERFVWTHRWLVGDLIIWDNRCVMHRRDAFDPNTRRLMFRTQVAGAVPV